MKKSRYKNAFEALEADPGVAENLKIRAQLMNALISHMDKQRLTQTQAAELLGVSQPRISDLVRGKIERFTIDMLVNMLVKTGKRVNIKLTGRAA